jgi:biotin transport system substrate-specific component
MPAGDWSITENLYQPDGGSLFTMQVLDTVERCRLLTSAPLYKWREDSSVATKVAAAALFALLTALAAQVRFVLPFTPVPFTGQVLLVLLGAVVLGRYGVLSQGMYLGMGASFGWFSGMAGAAALAGVTGGYLIGFVLASFVLGELVERRREWSGWQVTVTMALGVLVIYAAGTLQLALVLGLGPWDAVAMGAMPFIVVDALKVVIATGAASLFLRPRSA